MHEKRSKIDFFVNFRKLQKQLPICKKRYAEILNVARTVVTIVEKNEKWNGRNFFGSHLEEQSVVKKITRRVRSNIAAAHKEINETNFPQVCATGAI